jgi:Icc-related predicted phosphoesterase
MTRIVCISDTHLVHEHFALKVPPGDIVLHAGDATLQGSSFELASFVRWFARLPHQHKILIAGNHDFVFELNPAAGRTLLSSGITYLQDSEVEIHGLRIYGSPWTPYFRNWAFNLPRGSKIRKKWALIPDGIDVLITHGPPAGGGGVKDGKDLGCADLSDAVARLRPHVHLFGHVHEGYGISSRDQTVLINASICDDAYRPLNRPIVVDL